MNTRTANVASMSNSQTNMRLDDELKTAAKPILKQLGLDLSSYTSMALSQLVLRKGLPFEVKIPNAETQAALDEPREQGMKFSSPQEMFDYLDSMPEESDDA